MNRILGMVQNRVTLKLRISLNNGETFKKSVTLPVITLNHAIYLINFCIRMMLQWFMKGWTGIRLEKPKHYVIPESLMGIRTLIVDDNETCRVVMKDYLEDFGLTVDTIDSGTRAVETLKATIENDRKHVGLVFIDWQMPDMDGINAARHIHTHLGVKNIPKIIMVTGFGREDVMKQAEDIHLDGFLLKPIIPSLLFNAIMEAFGQEIEHKVGRDRDESLQPEGFDAIRGARILLVEDNEINQQVATELLEGAGFVISVAENGQAALDTLRISSGDHTFDVVLMDLQMPVMDGLPLREEFGLLK